MRRHFVRAMVMVVAASSGAACTGQIGPLPSDRASRPGADGAGVHPGGTNPLDPSSNNTGADPGADPGTNPADPTNPMDPTNSTNPTDMPFDSSKCAPPPGRVVRLSKLELQNSIADLLTTKRIVDLPDDAKFLNFSSNAEALVTPPFGNALKSAAEALSADFRGAVKPSELGSNCSTSDAAARTCATTFVQTYGKKAFRRPLTQQDTDALLAVYDAGRETGADGDVLDRFKAGLDYTLRAMLESPDFVYRVELGDPSAIAQGITKLTPYEAASSLSYMLLASPPDDALLAAAAQGRLSSPDALETEARRLLAAKPDRFAAQERRFVREWLGIDFTVPAWDKSLTTYPLYSASLKAALDEETDLYIGDWASQSPTLTALLTGTSTFVNSVSAPVYGLTASSTAMTKVSLDPMQRSGILTMPGFLGTRAHTDSSAPILRGISIVRDVMCGTIPPPPPNVPPLPPITDTKFTTTRDRVEQHVAAGACPGCHTHINPLGYPFESYDGLGVFRKKENGYDVDPSGAIVGTVSSDRTVANAIELTQALADSPEVQDCFGRQVFRYTFGRQDTRADACSMHDASEAYRAKKLDARELLVAFLRSSTFTERSSN